MGNSTWLHNAIRHDQRPASIKGHNKRVDETLLRTPFQGEQLSGHGHRDLSWQSFLQSNCTRTSARYSSRCQCRGKTPAILPTLPIRAAFSLGFETFVRCHVHAFQKLNGIAREVWYDNLATAVAEHDGRLVRFNPRFLAFAREFDFYPRACNQASGWEKGKVERAASVTYGKTSGRCAISLTSTT